MEEKIWSKENQKKLKKEEEKEGKEVQAYWFKSLHEKKKALETREGAKKRKREIIDRKLIHVEETRGLRF